MLARPARRTLDVMSLAARPIWFRSDVNAPVAAGKPIIPSRMYVSSVMPTREVEVGGDFQLTMGVSLVAMAPACRIRRAGTIPGLGPGPGRAISRENPSTPMERPMALTDRVKQILSWYSSENPGTLTNLVRLLNHGTLAGTGKLVILPVDQGFEHGPVRSFAPNPDAFDPDYHYQLAIDAGCNAYAAPLGSLEAGAAKFAGQVPLILKLNNSDTLAKIEQPCSALTASVDDALRLGCVGIGYTIYPGSGARNRM